MDTDFGVERPFPDFLNQMIQRLCTLPKDPKCVPKLPSLSVLIRNFKILLFTFLFLLVSYRIFLLTYGGGGYCRRILTNDNKIDPYNSRFLQCLINGDPKRTIGLWRSKKQIAFVGGESVFKLYEIFHSRMKYSKPCFIWMPVANDNATSSIGKWINSTGKSGHSQERSPENCTGITPSTIVIGPKPDYARSDAKGGLVRWRNSLQNIADIFRRRSDLKYYWILPDSNEFQECSTVRSSAQIADEYNEVAVNVLSRIPSVTVFSGNRRTYELYQTKNITDIGGTIPPHTRANIAQTIALLLAHVIENQFSNCCVIVNHVEPCQLRLLNVYIFILETCIFCGVVKALRSNSKRFNEIKILASEVYAPMLTATRFGLLIVYLYVERCTKVFELVSLNYRFNWFIGSIPILLLLGVIFIRNSKKVTFNNTDLTQEWKGWMQLYIVIFHLFHIRLHFLPGEVVSRIVVSHYLCLSGFGHFSYYWKRVAPDVEYTKVLKLEFHAIRNLGYVLWLDMKRFMDVMFRLNFLLLIVCVAMNEKYMEHYFMPLIMVWFALVALCMTIYPSVTKAILYTNSPSATKGSTEPAPIIPATDGPNGESKELTVHNCGELSCLTAADTLTQPSSDKIFSWNRYLYAITVMLTKFILLAFFVGWIVRRRNVFDRIFLGGFQMQMSDLFRKYWYHRFKNDCYSVIYGLIFGLICESILPLQPYIFCAYRKFINQVTTPYFARRWPRCTKVIESGCSESNNAFIFVPFGVILFCISIGVYAQCNNENFNEVNKYYCIFPFLSYVLLRNVLPGIRNHVSLFLVGVGEMSMEVYVLHRYKSDTLLVKYFLAPDIVNLVLQLVILLCIADEAHQLTRRMHPHLIPRKPIELLWKGPILFFVWYYMLLGF